MNSAILANNAYPGKYYVRGGRSTPFDGKVVLGSVISRFLTHVDPFIALFEEYSMPGHHPAFLADVADVFLIRSLLVIGVTGDEPRGQQKERRLHYEALDGLICEVRITQFNFVP